MLAAESRWQERETRTGPECDNCETDAIRSERGGQESNPERHQRLQIPLHPKRGSVLRPQNRNRFQLSPERRYGREICSCCTDMNTIRSARLLLSLDISTVRVLLYRRVYSQPVASRVFDVLCSFCLTLLVRDGAASHGAHFRKSSAVACIYRVSGNLQFDKYIYTPAIPQSKFCQI